MTTKRWGVIVCCWLAAVFPGQAFAGENLSCELFFNLSGWSFFYKTAQGTGVIRCHQGPAIPVKISAKGGGLTIGRSEILNGHGKFSGTYRVDELLGTYGGADAHAGVVKSSHAQIVTKGHISLALAGTGKGVDLGIGFGNFTISRR